MRWMYIGEHTKMLWMFRRLNNCPHKFSCVESILRKFYKAISVYSIIRIPLHFLLSKFFETPFSKTFIIVETMTVLAFSLVYAAGGCFVRYLHEEVLQPVHYHSHRHHII
jgi:hypothetical protein